MCPDCQSCDPGVDCFCSCHACFNCGELGCPGYCDDYQTYNLRPDETGGAPVTDPETARIMAITGQDPE